MLEVTPQEDESRPALVENLAASIYKQGEQANEHGEYRAAADHFLRVGQVAPTSKICAGAQYDAGAALIRLKDWTTAADVLDTFRRTYPGHELEKEATKQLAFVHREAGQLSQAAGEYERVAAESESAEHARRGVAARGRPVRAVEERRIARWMCTRATSSSFRSRSRRPSRRASRSQRSTRRGTTTARYHEQLKEIVRIDAAAGSERTDRTAMSPLAPRWCCQRSSTSALRQLKLLQPFERSLQDKRRAMDAAIEAFGNLVAYEVGEVTAAATFYMAEVYSNFSRSLVESERPAGLSAADLQKYEDAIEEEAFPFEEKAIEVHEKNLELMPEGIYNAWTEKSLARLAVLKPGRYAKAELSSGFLGSIDRYVYRHPEPPGGPGRQRRNDDAAASPPQPRRSCQRSAPARPRSSSSINTRE